MKRIVLGMTGATGAVLGIELLRQLQGCADVETHLVLSRWARATIHLETELSAGDVESLAKTAKHALCSSPSRIQRQRNAG